MKEREERKGERRGERRERESEREEGARVGAGRSRVAEVAGRLGERGRGEEKVEIGSWSWC